MRLLLPILILTCCTTRAATPPINLVVWESWQSMEKNKQLDWSNTNVELVISLPRFALYWPDVPRSEYQRWMREAKEMADGRPFGFSFYGYSERMTWDKSTLTRCQPHALPEPEWKLFLANWTMLCEEANKADAQILIMDSEIYPFAGSGNGGMMSSKAWATGWRKPDGTREEFPIEERARLYGDAAAANQMPLGTYVYWSDVQARPGFRRWWKAAGLDEGWDERTFYKHDYAAAKDIRRFSALPVPGLWKGWDKLDERTMESGIRQAAKGFGVRRVWLYDEIGSFLKSQKPLDKLGRVAERLDGAKVLDGPPPGNLQFP